MDRSETQRTEMRHIRALAVNLEDQAERWRSFLEALPSDWPFARPERFAAIDLRGSPMPPGLVAGQEGCRLSHLAALERIAEDGRDALLLEDDCRWTPKMSRVVEALRHLPDDWAAAWLGGHQDWANPSVEIGSAHWLAARGLTMTHAILIRASAAAEIHSLLREETSHPAVDMRWSALMSRGALRVYRLEPWAAWQAAGVSLLAGCDRSEEPEWWTWDTDQHNSADDHALTHPRGWYLGDQPHCHDPALADAIAGIVSGSVIDLGCGRGEYVALLRARGIQAWGYDGHPHTTQYGEHLAVADLTRPLEIKQAEWVISLEVGEHIPPRLANNFLNNIDALARRGVILSWAVPGQGGLAHCNERPNQEIARRMEQRGWRLDVAAQERLRSAASLPWMRSSLMVFRRPWGAQWPQ